MTDIVGTPDRRRLVFALGLLVLLAALAIGLMLARLGGGTKPTDRQAAPAGIAARPPAVEPVIVADIPPETARKINAADPFLTDELVPARPFAFQGPPVDRERAVTCLASAAWYEAGDDAEGERAVVQVVLNRVRHPAFPKTVCGVVFQGSERATGCQFTFTCDGALARQPSDAAWKRARAIAARALGGEVDRSVGTATHYHADWVVPYWKSSLDKIAAVHTHLFYRWRGWWGERAAFSGHYAGGEAIDPRLVHLADPALVGMPTPVGLETNAPAPLDPKQAVSQANLVRLVSPSGDEFVAELKPQAFAGEYAVFAYTLCKKQPACMVRGWIDRQAIPAALPVTDHALRSLTFLYRKDARTKVEQVLWNCRQLPREDPAQCIPGSAGGKGAKPADTPAK